MNPELIEQTVRDYSGKLLKIAYTYTKNTCDAEDIVQEVFLSFITSRQEFASQEHIRAWLIRVTINTRKNHVKSAWIAKRSKMPEPCEELSCLELQKKDGLFKLSRHPLKAKEMLIIDFNLTVNSNSTISLQGSMKYADSNYGIGYLLNGTFHDVQKTSMDGTVDCSVTLKESGTFYWCINNTSGNTNYFSGNIQYRPDPPVYRDYGAGAISAEEGCTIQLSHIQGLLGDTEITGIFVYCHEKNMAKEYPEDTDSITFTVPEKGTYSIYAITKQGGLMDLNAYLSVDYPSDYKISNTT